MQASGALAAAGGKGGKQIVKQHTKDPKQQTTVA